MTVLGRLRVQCTLVSFYVTYTGPPMSMSRIRWAGRPEGGEGEVGRGGDGSIFQWGQVVVRRESKGNFVLQTLDLFLACRLWSRFYQVFHSNQNFASETHHFTIILSIKCCFLHGPIPNVLVRIFFIWFKFIYAVDLRPVHQKVAHLISGQGTYLRSGFYTWWARGTVGKQLIKALKASKKHTLGQERQIQFWLYDGWLGVLFSLHGSLHRWEHLPECRRA